MTEEIQKLPGAAGVPICRRAFLEKALKASLATWAAGLAFPAAAYLWPARSEGPGGSIVKAGLAESIAIGKATIIAAGGAPILIVRPSAGELRAFSAVCTHLGCLVEWRSAKGDIYCPCHGGRFDLDGKVVGGPPPRPLPRYPVSVEKGQILVQVKAE